MCGGQTKLVRTLGRLSERQMLRTALKVNSFSSRINVGWKWMFQAPRFASNRVDRLKSEAVFPIYRHYQSLRQSQGFITVTSLAPQSLEDKITLLNIPTRGLSMVTKNWKFYSIWIYQKLIYLIHF